MKTNETKKKAGKRPGRYPAEMKLQAVKLHLEEGYSAEMVAEELGVGRKLPCFGAVAPSTSCSNRHAG